MATQAGHFAQDQNFNVPFDGAPLGRKSNLSKARNKGAISGRKALNDISNSGKPSAFQASNKHNSVNVISIGEDISGRKAFNDVSNSGKLLAHQQSKKHNSENAISIGEDLCDSKIKNSVGGNVNVTKAPEKAQVHGRKALSDVTNSGKPFTHQVSKKNQNKKLIAVAEEDIPSSVAEERFLHDHKQCIKAQRKDVHLDYFLKAAGLDDGISLQLASAMAPPSLSRNSDPESCLKHPIMEEISESIEDQPPHSMNLELTNQHNSETCGSPEPVKQYMHWKDNFPDFILMESPQLLAKH